ncbi:MAG: hypothetical protein LBQ22_05580 [Bacteroidales bacterium]|jgi:hypothetical protein|nr:hypothetical protein [Bacteroidales bacterium]
MKARPNIPELAKEVFEINKAKGFHCEEYSNEHFLMLVVTELSEAVEADRSNRFHKRADMEWFNRRISTSRYYKGLDPEVPKERAYEVIYNETIKGSIEEELADTVIRLLDLIGLRGYNDIKDFLITPTVSVKKTFTENIFSICKDIVYYKYSEPERISYALLNIERLCQLLNIDLWLHVELKLQYNKNHKTSKNY